MKRLTISGHACTETLALMIAVAWADERLDDREKAGVRGAAQVLNLTKALRERLDHLLEKPAKISDLLLEPLNEKDRAFAYVASAWMAHVDEELHPKEVELLDEIAGALGLDKTRQEHLMQVAKTLEPLPDGVQNWAEQLTQLFKAIAPKIEEGAELEVKVEE